MQMVISETNHTCRVCGGKIVIETPNLPYQMASPFGNRTELIERPEFQNLESIYCGECGIVYKFLPDQKPFA